MGPALFAAVVAIALSGCKRPETASGPADPAQSEPATRTVKPPPPIPNVTTTASGHNAPATLPAATKPLASYIVIGERRYTFPPARIYVHKKDDQVTATLFSDEGKVANYDGNSYLLDVKLDVDNPRQLASAEWHYKAPNSDRVDSPYGIFLEGVRYQLQPFDVAIAFDAREPGSDLVTATVRGLFLRFDTRDPLSPGDQVPVVAKLTAKPEVK